MLLKKMNRTQINVILILGSTIMPALCEAASDTHENNNKTGNSSIPDPAVGTLLTDLDPYKPKKQSTGKNSDGSSQESSDEPDQHSTKYLPRRMGNSLLVSKVGETTLFKHGVCFKTGEPFEVKEADYYNKPLDIFGAKWEDADMLWRAKRRVLFVDSTPFCALVQVLANGTEIGEPVKIHTTIHYFRSDLPLRRDLLRSQEFKNKIDDFCATYYIKHGGEFYIEELGDLNITTKLPDGLVRTVNSHLNTLRDEVLVEINRPEIKKNIRRNAVRCVTKNTIFPEPDEDSTSDVSITPDDHQSEFRKSDERRFKRMSTQQKKKYMIEALRKLTSGAHHNSGAPTDGEMKSESSDTRTNTKSHSGSKCKFMSHDTLEDDEKKPQHEVLTISDGEELSSIVLTAEPMLSHEANNGPGQVEVSSLSFSTTSNSIFQKTKETNDKPDPEPESSDGVLAYCMCLGKKFFKKTSCLLHCLECLAWGDDLDGSILCLPVCCPPPHRRNRTCKECCWYDFFGCVRPNEK